jgi:ABC-type transport system substrate-binding protein
VRARAAASFQRIIDADAPVIIIYARTFLSAFDSRLSGYHPNSFSYWGDPLQLDI